MRWKTKSGYGVAEIGLGAMELLLQIYLLELYVTIGLNPILAGIALALAVFWDAVSDPLMGLISDSTKSKTAAGKRLPYYLAGSVLMGVAFSYLFSPPTADLSQASLFIYLLIWNIVLNTAHTLVGVPHLAMVNDLAGSRHDRASLFSWRLAFGSLGLLLGLVAPVAIAEFNGQKGIESDPALLITNRSQVGLWIAAISFPLALFTCWAVWKPLTQKTTVNLESTGSKSEAASGFRVRQLTSAFRSRLFLLVTASFVLIGLGRAFNASLALLYYKQRLQFTESQIAVLLLVLTVTVMISAPIWLKLSKRFAKGQLCLAGVTALALMTAISYPLLPVGVFWPTLVIAAAGGFMVACVALLEAMFSDVIEIDQCTRRQPITGTYYGTWKLATKIARALGLACSGLLLWIIGYREGTVEQSDSVAWGITIAFGPGVAVFFAAGAYLVYKSGKALEKSDDQAVPCNRDST